MNNLDLSFGSIQHHWMELMIDLNRNSNLIMIFSINKSDKRTQLPSSLSLFTFEKISQFKHTQHLTGSITELSQNNAFISELIPVVIVLLPTQTSDFTLFLFLDIIVTDVSISKEVLDFESIEFLFVSDYPHGSLLFLFSDQGSGSTFLKDTDLRDEEPHLPG